MSRPPIRGPATEQVANTAREQALVTAAFARRHQIADDRLRQHDQPAGPQALDGPECDQLEEVPGDGAQHRPYEEDRDRNGEGRPAPVEVAEAAVQGRRHGAGDHEGADDPGQVLQAAKLAGDARQRRRDDVLVEGGQRQRPTSNR